MSSKQGAVNNGGKHELREPCRLLLSVTFFTPHSLLRNGAEMPRMYVVPHALLYISAIPGKKPSLGD
jgi:hypothetical protein